jgi:hypothetical protein
MPASVATASVSSAGASSAGASTTSSAAASGSIEPTLAPQPATDDSIANTPQKQSERESVLITPRVDHPYRRRRQSRGEREGGCNRLSRGDVSRAPRAAA